MMQFCSPLDIRCYKAGEFVLLANFKVDFDFNGGRYRLIIPRTFVTDFASVPKAVQILPGFDVNGGSREAAVVHDFSYCCAGQLTVRDLSTGLPTVLDLSRKDCDGLLFDGLVASDYSKPVANIFYLGVRIGGGFHWRKRSAGLDNEDFVPDSYWDSYAAGLA